MTLFKQNIARGTLVSVIALALVATTAGIANAAAPVSDGPLGLFNPGDDSAYPAGKIFDWDTETVGGQSTTNALARFECGSNSTQVRTFISPVGSERSIPSWVAYADAGRAISNLEPTLTPESQVLGSQAAARATGGDFSIGIACLINDGVGFASSGLWFTTIHVTPGTGKYTVDQPGTTPPVTGGESAEIPLSATVGTAVDGALSLVVTAGSSAAIGTQSIVDGKSTSTGTLPDFTVKDARALTHKGWTLTSKVTDFVSGSTIIPAAQLTVTPTVKSTTAVGVTAAGAAAASNTDVPFASATDAAQVGDTVLNAALKFVAPSASTPAGTYTSKMTLTLVSK